LDASPLRGAVAKHVGARARQRMVVDRTVLEEPGN
jgi:hypothetical protein